MKASVTNLKLADVSLLLSFLEGVAFPPEDLLELLLLPDDRDGLLDDCKVGQGKI